MAITWSFSPAGLQGFELHSEHQAPDWWALRDDVEAQAHACFMTDDVAVRKAAGGERWMQAMTEFGTDAGPATATSMVAGTLTAALRGGFDVDRDDLGERLRC